MSRPKLMRTPSDGKLSSLISGLTGVGMGLSPTAAVTSEGLHEITPNDVEEDRDDASIVVPTDLPSALSIAESLRRVNAGLKADIKRYPKQVAALQTDLDLMRERVVGAEARSRHLHHKVTFLESQAAILQAQAAEHEQALKDALDRAEKQLKKEMRAEAAAEAAISQLRAEGEEMARQLAASQAETLQARLTAEHEAALRSAVEDKCAQLQKAFNAEIISAQTAAAEADIARATAAELSVAAANSARKLEDAKSASQAAQRDKQAEQARALSAALERADSAQRAHAACGDLRSEYEARLASAELTISALRDSRAAAQAAHAEKCAAEERAREGLLLSERRADGLARALAEYEAAEEVTRHRTASLEAQLCTAQLHREKAIVRIAEAEAEVVRLQGRLSAPSDGAEAAEALRALQLATALESALTEQRKTHLAAIGAVEIRARAEADETQAALLALRAAHESEKARCSSLIESEASRISAAHAEHERALRQCETRLEARHEAELARRADDTAHREDALNARHDAAIAALQLQLAAAGRETVDSRQAVTATATDARRLIESLQLELQAMQQRESQAGEARDRMRRQASEMLDQQLAAIRADAAAETVRASSLERDLSRETARAVAAERLAFTLQESVDELHAALETTKSSLSESAREVSSVRFTCAHALACKERAEDRLAEAEARADRFEREAQEALVAALRSVRIESVASAAAAVAEPETRAHAQVNALDYSAVTGTPRATPRITVSPRPTGTRMRASKASSPPSQPAHGTTLSPGEVSVSARVADALHSALRPVGSEKGGGAGGIEGDDTGHSHTHILSDALQEHARSYAESVHAASDLKSVVLQQRDALARAREERNDLQKQLARVAAAASESGVYGSAFKAALSVRRQGAPASVTRARLLTEYTRDDED